MKVPPGAIENMMLFVFLRVQ